jgi:hypothetical protein
VVVGSRGVGGDVEFVAVNATTMGLDDWKWNKYSLVLLVIQYIPSHLPVTQTTTCPLFGGRERGDPKMVPKIGALWIRGAAALRFGTLAALHLFIFALGS